MAGRLPALATPFRRVSATLRKRNPRDYRLRQGPQQNRMVDARACIGIERHLEPCDKKRNQAKQNRADPGPPRQRGHSSAARKTYGNPERARMSGDVLIDRRFVANARRPMRRRSLPSSLGQVVSRLPPRCGIQQKTALAVRSGWCREPYCCGTCEAAMDIEQDQRVARPHKRQRLQSRRGGS